VIDRVRDVQEHRRQRRVLDDLGGDGGGGGGGGMSATLPVDAAGRRELTFT
jgi:hypothetical protein